VFKGRAHFFTDPKARNAAAAMKIFLAEQKAYMHPRTVPVSVWVNFLVQRPQSAPKRVLRPVTRPDIDQYIKLLLDAGNGVLWVDDSQVCHLTVEKAFAPDDRPRIEITVSAAMPMLVTQSPAAVWSARGELADGKESPNAD
jgi:Holliday junction resolvase RusA-like endonuclease